MADTMQFDLVSPERRLASRAASEVLIPGTEGELTAMPGHAPMITTLRPGLLRVQGPEGEDAYVVTGGFAEIGAEGVSVLAERAFHVRDVNREIIEGFIAEARAELERVRETGAHDLVDDAAKVLADMVALGDHINA